MNPDLEAVWLLVSGQDVDGVAVERVIAVYSSEEKAAAALIEAVSTMPDPKSPRYWWHTESFEVDPRKLPL